MRNVLLPFCLLGLAACQQETTATLPGYVEGDYVRIATPVAGYLRALAVTEGQTVKAGEPLFRLENSETSTNQQSAQASLKKRRRSPPI